MGRSREGAWIEMGAVGIAELYAQVAPVRERGLKYLTSKSYSASECRSREGAWIEIQHVAGTAADI